ncbi:MAG: DNA-deoxyinosine glycosylase [Gammaproteobacteria bacterium]
MNPDHGFPPLSTPQARILILGSMPSRQSLEQHQYYGNPHNAFWRIMSEYTDVAETCEYSVRVEGLHEAGIAVWDVIKQCVRPGSLDADIDKDSIEVNDFAGFFDRHPEIQAVFLNGGKAAYEYKRRVVPRLTQRHVVIPAVQLLSTSPANARYSLAQKKLNWSQIQSSLAPHIPREV